MSKFFRKPKVAPNPVIDKRKKYDKDMSLACLGTFTKNYYDKIAPIYAKYDSRGNGLLSCEDFIRFYTDSALDKPSTVWSNIRNLGVKGNFKFKD